MSRALQARLRELADIGEIFTSLAERASVEDFAEMLKALRAVAWRFHHNSEEPTRVIVEKPGVEEVATPG